MLATTMKMNSKQEEKNAARNQEPWKGNGEG